MKPAHLRTARRFANGWTIASIIGAAAMLLPLMSLLATLFQPATDNWRTVKKYLLSQYILETGLLVLFTGTLAVLLGVVLAWLVTGYAFPLSRFFRWAFILPLAIPPYVAAYTYGAMTSYTGFIQSTLRNVFHLKLPPGTIELTSMRGAVFILTLFLFPYVFMITRAYLERQSASYIENAMLLGRKSFSLFFRVVLPLARPAIAAGTMLVVFEVLSDYGVANFFGVQTISRAIFQTWFGMYDANSAMRLAAWLMLLVIGLFVIERYWRRNRRYASTTSREQPLRPKRLRGIAAIGATLLCSFIFLLAFLVPFIQLVAWSVKTYRKVWHADFMALVSNSLTAGALATVFILLLALLSARTVRYVSSPVAIVVSRLMTAGYAIPGAIVAVGVLGVFLGLDHGLSPLYEWMGKGAGALVLSMSLAMLIFGYIVRFMATGYNAIEAGYEKLPRNYADASRTLGHSNIGTFFKVELPLLKNAVWTGFVLTFVEIVKELPLTLLLQPFNFDTLATRVYRYAMDERIYEAAPPSLLLIGISLIPVLFIIRKGRSTDDLRRD